MNIASTGLMLWVVPCVRVPCVGLQCHSYLRCQQRRIRVNQLPWMTFVYLEKKKKADCNKTVPTSNQISYFLDAKTYFRKPLSEDLLGHIEAVWAVKLFASSNVIYVTVLKSFAPVFSNYSLDREVQVVFACVMPSPPILSQTNVAKNPGGGTLLFH